MPKKNTKYAKFSEKWIDDGWTPLFEYCSPRVKIVLFYGSDVLVCIAIRHIKTGEYLLYDKMVAACKEFDIPVTDKFDVTDMKEEVFDSTGKIVVKNFEEFQTKLKATPRIEGFVVRFDNGSMYKMKTEWYFARTHKSKQKFSFNSERAIWKLVLDGDVDDAMGFLKDDVMAKRIREFESELWEKIEELAKSMLAVVKKLRSDLEKEGSLIRGEFAARAKELDGSKKMPAYLGLLYSMFEVSKLSAVIGIIVNCLKKNCTAKKLEYSKELLGGIQFVEG